MGDTPGTRTIHSMDLITDLPPAGPQFDCVLMKSALSACVECCLLVFKLVAFSFSAWLPGPGIFRRALGYKRGKTDEPAHTQVWIGYLFLHRSMQVALEEKRLLKMRADLLPYREATTEQVMAGNLRVTDKEVEHTLGVLEFASNVLVLGKAYFRGMRELQQSAGKRRPGARPRQLVVPMAAAHGMQMWYALIANIAVRSAQIQ